MKTIFAFLLLIPFYTFSQNFEATIVWTIKTEGLSPEALAQSEKSKKELNDPKNQEKIRQMQEKMNSPEMKAVFEKNPQMKTQMENAIKAMQGGETGSLMPEGMTLKIKGNNSLMITKGGVAAAEILTIGSKNQSYRIDRNARTYTLLNSSTGKTVSNPDTNKNYTVTKTNETMKVLNYTCTKYIVTSKKDNQISNHFFWTTTDVRGFDPAALRRSAGRNGQAMYFEGVEGFPMRMEMDLSKMKMIFEVTELNRGSIPATEFEIPEGYTEKKGY